MQRAHEDLRAKLEEILQRERDDYEAVNRSAIQRGIYRSGIRMGLILRVAQEQDRARERAVQDWRRALQDAAVSSFPEPPRSSRTFGERFEADGRGFSRQSSSGMTVFCHCGRLAYEVESGGAVSQWCPEHEYQVS